jgi:DNA-binding cell septation regulator SpoVG
MQVEIVDLRLLSGDRPLKGFADVRVNGWIIHDFRVIKQSGQKVTVSPPQVSWKDPATGEIKFKGVLTIPSEQKQEIDIEILAAYQRKVERKNEKGNQS